jgi:hypothetical protein
MKIRTDVGPAYVPGITIGEPQKHKRETYVEHGEFGEDRAELFVKSILREFDLAHVKVTDATDLEVFVNNLRMTMLS